MLFIVCVPRAEVKRGLQRVAQALIEPPLGAQQRAGHRGLVDAQLFYEFNIDLMRSLYGEEYIKRLLKQRLDDLSHG